MKLVHVLVVDDEELARRAVVRAAARRPEVARITECLGGAEAVEALRTGGIDLVFLDVRMPEVGGFDVVRSIGAAAMPPVVFVTAFDSYAIAAFEVRALDYLLKPFSEARFDDSFTRALEAATTREGAAAEDRFDGLAGDSDTARMPDRLKIRIAGRTSIVLLKDVIWIEAANTYVRIHTNNQVFLLRASIGALAEQLDPAQFARVHRSAIVALESVSELTHIARGDYHLVLSNGDRVRVTRRRRGELLERLGKRTP